MRTLLSIACLAALVAEARPAEACSCSAPGPACEIYWQHDLVFAGKVVANRAHQGKLGEFSEATFEVSEAFAGSPGPRVVVSGSGGCGYSFEDGAEYLVYARKGAAGYVTGACSGTKLLRDAAADLAYARNPPRRKLAVVEGTVHVESDADPRGNVLLVPRRGAVVTARGTASSARTGKDGRYRLELPPGSYTLDVADPGTRVRGGQAPTVALRDPAACARRDIIAVWNGRIRGRLLDHAGRPAANVEVSAHAPSGSRQRWRLDARTDAAGRYEIDEVPEGAFVVAVGHPRDGGPDERQPIPTTFYPGTGTEAKARPIAMKRAGLVTGIDFQLPPPLAVHTISGVVKQRGAPLPKANVRLHNETWPRGTGMETDAAGRYAFREVAGAEVTLELCRPDVTAATYKTACVQEKRRITGDVVVDLEMPR